MPLSRFGQVLIGVGLMAFVGLLAISRLHDFSLTVDDLADNLATDQHLADSIHVAAGTDREAYIDRRQTRDATLALPLRIMAALQINLRAGDLREPEDNAIRYLKIPLDAV